MLKVQKSDSGDGRIRTDVSKSNHNTVLTCLVILYTVTRVNLLSSGYVWSYRSCSDASLNNWLVRVVLVYEFWIHHLV